MTAPAHFIGFCDSCRKARVCGSETARQVWLETHDCEDDS